MIKTSDEKLPPPDVPNVIELVLVWSGFVLGFALLPRIPFGLVILAALCLAFQSHLHGVIHEAAHGTLITGNRRMNELLGNWGGAYVRGYTVDAYRAEHFKHHGEKIFLVPEDGETAGQIAGSPVEMLVGLLKDLFLVTAVYNIYLRLAPKSRGRERRVRPFREVLTVLGYSAVVWPALAWIGSPAAVAVYWFSYLSLYLMSERIFVYATHGDPRLAQGLKRTDVTCNVRSPFIERIFFGDRMLMNHAEHHQNPGLPFREVERLARRRLARGDAALFNRSYLLTFLRFLGNRAVPAGLADAGGPS